MRSCSSNADTPCAVNWPPSQSVSSSSTNPALLVARPGLPRPRPRRPPLPARRTRRPARRPDREPDHPPRPWSSASPSSGTRITSTISVSRRVGVARHAPKCDARTPRTEALVIYYIHRVAVGEGGSGVAKYMEIKLEKRNVSCVARLLEYEAPETCDIVLDALPITGDARHAKYAMNEVYCLVPRLAATGPVENSTIVPTTGDVVLLFPGYLARSFREEKGLRQRPGVVDLAVFDDSFLQPRDGLRPGQRLRDDRRGHGRDGKGDARRLWAQRQRLGEQALRPVDPEPELTFPLGARPEPRRGAARRPSGREPAVPARCGAPGSPRRPRRLAPPAPAPGLPAIRSTDDHWLEPLPLRWLRSSACTQQHGLPSRDGRIALNIAPSVDGDGWQDLHRSRNQRQTR